MLMSRSDDPPKGIGRRSHMGICREHCQTSNKEALMKNRKNYVMTKSNLTLTQSGLLAVLLQRQRHKVCMRCASRERSNKESKPNMKTLIMTILFAFAFASSALAQSLFAPARYSDEVAVID